MASAAVTSKGQVTIPREVRVKLGITTGDRLEFQVLPDGTLAVKRRKQGSLSDVFGILARPGQPAVSVEEMNEAIASLHAKTGRAQASVPRPRSPRPASGR